MNRRENKQSELTDKIQKRDDIRQAVSKGLDKAIDLEFARYDTIGAILVEIKLAGFNIVRIYSKDGAK